MTQTEAVLYTPKAHTTGGREGGSSRTDDDRLDVKIATPGGPGSGTNPEQLFAAGWSACFLSAIKVVAAKSRVKVPADAAIDAGQYRCDPQCDLRRRRANSPAGALPARQLIAFPDAAWSRQY